MTNDIIGPIVESALERITKDADELGIKFGFSIVEGWRKELTAALQAVAADSEARVRNKDMKIRFHSVEMVTEEDGREVILFGTLATPEVLDFARRHLGEEVSVLAAARLGEQGEGV